MLYFCEQLKAEIPCVAKSIDHTHTWYTYNSHLIDCWTKKKISSFKVEKIVQKSKKSSEKHLNTCKFSSSHSYLWLFLCCIIGYVKKKLKTKKLERKTHLNDKRKKKSHINTFTHSTHGNNGDFLSPLDVIDLIDFFSSLQIS